MLRHLIRVPYWLYWLGAVLGLAGGVWHYISNIDVVLGPDPKASGVSMEFVDLAEFTSREHLGPGKKLTIMAQINAKIEPPLGPIGEDQVERFGYVLFPAIAAPNEKNVRAVVVTTDRLMFENWLTQRIIGNAQMGALYTIPGRRLDDRLIKSAVIGWLSELGFSSDAEFVLIQPAFELPREQTYVMPPKAKLLVPILLITLAGILLILGFHMRSMQRHTELEDELDPILEVDPSNPED